MNQDRILRLGGERQEPVEDGTLACVAPVGEGNGIGNAGGRRFGENPGLFLRTAHHDQTGNEAFKKPEAPDQDAHAAHRQEDFVFAGVHPRSGSAGRQHHKYFFTHA